MKKLACGLGERGGCRPTRTGPSRRCGGLFPLFPWRNHGSGLGVWVDLPSGYQRCGQPSTQSDPGHLRPMWFGDGDQSGTVQHVVYQHGYLLYPVRGMARGREAQVQVQR